jgi:threonine aldolase
MDPEQVEGAIRAENVHFPRTALICLENTHNRAGGTILPPENVAAIAEVAHRYGIPVHMDGARVFNSAVAQGRSAAEVAVPADSVMFCLSKGLAAPVGSMLAGPRAFIARARRNRKLLGGGMRQAGILAAAGLVALRTMVDRLAEDHENARRLAVGLQDIRELTVETETIQTNIVAFDLEDSRWDAARFAGALGAAGLLCNAMGPRKIRLVTHKDVAAADVPEALDRIEGVLRAGPAAGPKATVYG